MQNISLSSLPSRRDDILLILVICSILLLLIYLHILQRIIARIISFLINIYLRKNNSSLFISSFTYSPLTGRVVLYRLRYATNSYCIRCDYVGVGLNWRLFFTKSADLTNTSLVILNLKGLYYHLYYREETYTRLKNIFSQLDKSTSLEEIEITKENYSRFFPYYYKVYFQVTNGLLLFGNSSIPKVLAFQFKTAFGTFSTEPTSSLEDPYKRMFVARTKSMKIVLLPSCANSPVTKSPFTELIPDKENTFLDTNVFIIKYKYDEPGIAHDVTLPPPEYTCSVWVSPNAHIYYSPWTNLHRLALQRMFFPWDYCMRDVDPVPVQGRKRIYNNFLVSFQILTESDANLQLHIGFSDPKSAANYSLLNISCANTSRLTIDYPWRETELGNTPRIFGTVNNVHVFSPTYTMHEIAEVKVFQFNLSMHFPRKWNGLQKWIYDFNVEHARINFVFTHLDFFDALLEDWNSLPDKPPDIQTFVPLNWQIDAKFNCFQIFTFLNQYNWINTIPGSKDNTLLAFIGKRGRIKANFPFIDYHPMRQEITFSAMGENMIGRLFIPHSLSVRDSIFSLNECNKDRWTWPTLSEPVSACQECVIDSHIGDAFEEDWITLGMGPFLMIDCSFTYTPETHHDQANSEPNNLKIFVDITDLLARLYGSLINILLSLKENYPGEYQIHQPYTESGPAIPYGGIPIPGKGTVSPLEVELVFNLKQAQLELPNFPNPWDNDCPILPSLYANFIEISFHRIIDQSSIRIITDPIFMTGGSSKQRDQDLVEMGFGFTEKVEFYGQSMLGQTNGEWQEYAWLVGAKLGPIISVCSLSQLSEIVSWLQTAFYHATATEDSYVYPKHQYCAGEQDIEMPGSKLKYQFILLEVEKVDFTIFQDCGASLLIEMPSLTLEFCNLHTCSYSHGLSLLIQSLTVSVLIPSILSADWVEVGYANIGQILVQSEMKLVENQSIEKQRAFLTQADVAKHLWFLYPEKAKLDSNKRILCGCKGGCFYLGSDVMSSVIDWLPHLKMSREIRRAPLSDYLDFLTPPIGNEVHSFSNLNSLFGFLLRSFYKTELGVSEAESSSAIERFQSINTNSTDSNELTSETASFCSAFSHLPSVTDGDSRVSLNSDDSNHTSIPEELPVPESFLSQFRLKVRFLNTNTTYHLFQMMHDIRQVNPDYFHDAHKDVYQTEIDPLTVDAFITNPLPHRRLKFSLPHFSDCKTARLTLHPNIMNIPTENQARSEPSESNTMMSLQISIIQNVDIYATTSVFKAITTLLESVQDTLITPHPLHLLNRVRNDFISENSSSSDLIKLSEVKNESFSISIFINPDVNLFFTLVRNTPIYHDFDTRNNSDEKRRFTFYSFISVVISSSLLQIQVSTSSSSRNDITASLPDTSLLTNQGIRAGFHLSILSLLLQSGLLFCLQPEYTSESISQAFEHIPSKQTKYKFHTPGEGKFISLSQFETGLDEILVTGCIKQSSDKKLKFVSKWWSLLSRTDSLYGSLDARCAGFFFHLPCARDVDLIKKHIAPSWITTLILFVDEVHSEVMPVLSYAKELIELRKSWSQDIFISLAAVTLGHDFRKKQVSPFFDEKSRYLHSCLGLEFLNIIQSIFLIEKESTVLEHIPSKLTKKYKIRILDSLFANFIFRKLSYNSINFDIDINRKEFIKFFSSTSWRDKLFILFGSFENIFTQFDFIPNNFKSELTAVNVYIRIQKLVVLISQNPQRRSLVIPEPTPLLSIEPVVSSIKVNNDSPLCRIPRYYVGKNDEPQKRLKLHITSTICISKLVLHFEVEDMILIYTSILGLKTHLTTMRDEFPSGIRTDPHQLTMSILKASNRMWHDWANNWIDMNDQLEEIKQSTPFRYSTFSNPRFRSAPTNITNTLLSPLHKTTRYEQIRISDIESGSGSNATTSSDNYISPYEGENNLNLFFALQIDNVSIFSPDEVNFNLSFESITLSSLVKSNIHHSKNTLSIHDDFTSLLTIGVGKGKLYITDADTHADLLQSRLKPFQGIAMVTLKNGYQERGLLPSLEHLHYMLHLNINDLKINILRPPDLLFDSISKIAVKLVHDISTIVNSYYSLEMENPMYARRKKRENTFSPNFFYDPSLPFNLPSGSILLDFNSAVLNIEALESISLQYEFSGFRISLATAPQNMRLSVLIDLHVILAISKITGNPLDTLNIPKIETVFEVKSLKPITFIPTLSIQSINLYFSVDLINQITALIIAYMYESRKLYYDLKPYLPKTSYEDSTLHPQSEMPVQVREATFSILDLLHSVKIHLDPINVSLTSSALTMRLATTTIDINIKNPNAFNYRRNLNKIQSGKFILMEKIQFDISLTLSIRYNPRAEPHELAYFRTRILTEDSISSDVHENIGDISHFEEYSNSKHLFLLTIVSPHLYLPTFAMENIFTYIIHWHGGYLFWQRQVRHHDYTAGNITPTIPVRTYPERVNPTPSFFDFFSSTIFMITIKDLGICIPVTYQARLSPNVPIHAFLCTVAHTSVSALFGKRSGAVGTFKDFRLGFQSQFNPSHGIWSITNVRTTRPLNSGCVEQGTCKLCFTYSLEDYMNQGKRDRVQVRLVFDMAGFESHMDSGIGFYLPALIKSITNVASGIEAVQESTSYDAQGSLRRTSFIQEESVSRSQARSGVSGTITERRHTQKSDQGDWANPNLSDKEFSSLVSDTIRNTPSQLSSQGSDKLFSEDDITPRKQDDLVGFLQAIDLDVNISIKIAHGKVLIDSTERNQGMEETKLYKRFASYPLFHNPSIISSNYSSDEASGNDYNHHAFSESSTLYIPGLDISVSYNSSIHKDKNYVSGSSIGDSTMPASPPCLKSLPARLHALVMIRSVPREMRILPTLIEFLDKITQPISNFAQSTSFLLGAGSSVPPSDHQPNILADDTPSSEFFPIDVLISIQLQPMIVKLSCLPISRVEAILQTPQIDIMSSFTIYKQRDPDFETSFSFKLLRSYLHQHDILNLYFMTNFNLTFYLSKLSLSVSSYLQTTQEESNQSKTRDALRVQLDRAKFNLFRRKANYSLDTDYNSFPVSTIDFSLVAVIGKLFFKYDMRRLTDVTTFRKCWYRQGFMNLIFLGANLANAHPSEPKPPKVKEVNAIESASIVIFSLQIRECEVVCNLADLMGDCDFNTKSLTINGHMGHRAQNLMLLSIKVLMEQAKFLAQGGVIAGNTGLDNANFYLSISKSQIHKLPSHRLSFDVFSFDGRLKYMGLTVLTLETCEIKTIGRDSWDETLGDLTLKLHFDIEWKLFRMMLTRSTSDSILKIFERLQRFVDEQQRRSRKMLARLLPKDRPPVVASLMAKMENEKKLEPPINKLFSVSWLWAVENGVFRLIENLGFTFSTCADLHLGGNVNISGGGFAIAFSPSDNFLIDTWTVISVTGLLIKFNTVAIPGLMLKDRTGTDSVNSFAQRICQQSFRIELLDRETGGAFEEKAGVYKVVRTKGPVPPADTSTRGWLDYTCIESKLRICPQREQSETSKYKTKTSPIPILSFPSCFIQLISDHFCIGNIDTKDIQTRVECNFDSSFYGEVAVTTNVDLYLFLHDLFKVYIQRLKVIAEKQTDEKPKQTTSDSPVDTRTFICDFWHLEPMLNVMSMVSWGSGSVNPHIDWLLDKLSLNKARTTIPKCIQRGAMDPIDHLLSLFLKRLLLFSAGKKSFSDMLDSN
ncbi:hypothetical protein LOD99_10086 [Oopsacas minuta]|uniref:Bridge-like lipid transfer protein family member 1 C-terminal domain-containing protein n=1 Tax=Oopsacas minuta TaxID=111878 RepID=A0AAV7KK06_9METZ|nr:hypothetical protein LOD99_10086 [Oopsacas minuta]